MEIDPADLEEANNMDENLPKYEMVPYTERSFWYATSMFLVVLAHPLTNFYAVFFKL